MQPLGETPSFAFFFCTVDQFPIIGFPYTTVLATILPSVHSRTVTAEQIQSGNPTKVEFDFVQMPLSVASIVRTVRDGNFDIVIMWVNLRHVYPFPAYLVVKGILRRKMVWWGQGRDLSSPNSILKNIAYAIEHALCDSIMLYAEHLRKYVARRFHHKIFIANNTLALRYPGLPDGSNESVLSSFGIQTRKNVICMGRFQNSLKQQSSRSKAATNPAVSLSSPRRIVTGRDIVRGNFGRTIGHAFRRIRKDFSSPKSDVFSDHPVVTCLRSLQSATGGLY
jgi:hypothetical protein